MRRVTCLLLVSIALPAQADTQSTIRAITLSTAGLALIEAEGPLGPEPLRLAIRRAHIDDFLKSLRLSDPEGGVPMLTMAGPGTLQDTFGTLPFDPAALSDLRALLDAMTGAPVEAERRGSSVSGAVMGMRELPCSGETAGLCVALTLRGEDGTLRQVLLDEATELTFTDASDRDAIERGLAALRMTARAQLIDVHLTSTRDAPRDVRLGWLQPAPIWKTAWRAEAGPESVTLTGWAVVENTTGQDWEDITLTLATGAVQALEVQLYDRIEAGLKLGAPAVEAELADMPQLARSTMAFEAEFDVVPTVMDDGETFSRFTLATPVTLRAGEMISLPFLSEALDAARLTLHRGGSRAAHPMIAIEFENPLSLRLPAGVVTVYESARGHAGDAMVPELAPGAREVIEFASDAAMRISESIDEGARITSATIVNGVLVSGERIERRTTYRIEGAPDADRTLTLLHPQRPGWDIEDTGGVSEFDATRYQVSVPAGEIVTHEVTEARSIRQEVALLSLDIETLAFWSGQISDPDVQERLRGLQDLRAQEADLRDAITRANADEAELIADQDRLAALIVQLGDDSPATQDRRARVDSIDAEIDALRGERRTAQDQLATLRDAVRALVMDN